MVGPPFYGGGGVAVGSAVVVGEYLAAENLHSRDAVGVVSAGDARDSDAVVADGGDGARHVRAVRIGEDRIAVFDKVLAALEAGRDAVGSQVGVLEVDTSVNHRHYHVAAAHGIFLPYVEQVHVGSLVGELRDAVAAAGLGAVQLQGHVVVKVPLPFEIGVVGDGAAFLDLAGELRVHDSVGGD